MSANPLSGPVRAYAADRVFDGDRTWDHHAVLVKGRTVLEIVETASLPPEVLVHRLAGATILPGLIDTHIHFMRWKGPVFLAYGVTTVRDTGNDLEWILQRREESRKQQWPRIVSLGPLLDGPSPSHPLVARSITDEKSAVEAVRETVAAGVDGIKLYASIKPHWIPAMVRESHQGGCKVSMHCAAHGVLVAGRAGVDEFYHHDGILADVWPERPPGWLHVWGDAGFSATWDRQQEVADAIAGMGMTATPTLAYWDSQWRMRSEVGSTSEEREYVPEDLFTWTSAKLDPVAAEAWKRGMEAAQRFTGLLLEREVRVLPGSDTPCGGILPGQSLWRELDLLVSSGMTPEQAIRSATSQAADFMEKPELGRLRAGSSADLIGLHGDPFQKIPTRPKIAFVVRDGVAYQHDELLKSARQSQDSWEEDPWGRQYASHWAGQLRRQRKDR